MSKAVKSWLWEAAYFAALILLYVAIRPITLEKMGAVILVIVIVTLKVKEQ